MSEKTCRFKSSRFLEVISKHRRGIIFLTFLTTAFACFQAWTILPFYKSAVVFNIEPVKIESSGGYRDRQIVLSLYEKMGDVLSSESLQLLIKDKNLFKTEAEKNNHLSQLAARINERLEIDDILIKESWVSSFKLSYLDRDAENAEAVIRALREKLAGAAENPNAQIKVLSYRSEPPATIYPQRWLIVGAGLAGGFFVSLMLAALITWFNSRK